MISIFGEYEMRMEQGFGLEHTTPEMLWKYQSWGLLGHNGWDVTPVEGKGDIIWPLEGFQFLRCEDRDKPDANGLFIVLWNSQKRLAVWLCHLKEHIFDENHFEIEIDKSLYIGDMGSTGYSTAPHVHIGAVETNGYAERINRDNGYNGAVDPVALFG